MMKHFALMILALAVVLLEGTVFRSLQGPFDAVSPILTALLMVSVAAEPLAVFVFAVALAFWSATFTPDGSAWLLLIFPALALAVRTAYRAFFTRLTVPGILATAGIGAILWSLSRLLLQAGVLLHEWEQVTKSAILVELATNFIGTALLMFGMSIFYNRFVIHRETAYLTR